MKVTPVAAPTDVTIASSSDSRARAVAAFNKAAVAPPPAAQEHPVQNPSAVAPEEMSAVQAPQVAEVTDNVPATEVEESKPAAEESEADILSSKQWAQLARQERALRAKAQQQQAEFKAKEAAIAAREAALTAKDQEYKQGYISRDRLKQDTLAALAEADVSYDELTQQIVSQQPKDPRLEAHISRLEAKISQLEAANETSKTSQAEQAQQAYQSAIKQITRDATRLVESDPQTYEAISKTNSVSDVVEYIEKKYAETGEIVSVAEAAQKIEDYLVNEGVNTFSRIDKIKKRILQASETPVKPDVKTQATETQTQPQMKTLTNAASSTRQLSARERALLAFKGELKS
jgi:hypothetical protein